MSEITTKKILSSSPDMVDGYQMQNIVEVSVSSGFVWFTRQGMTLHWKLSDWDDLVAFVSSATAGCPPREEE